MHTHQKLTAIGAVLLGITFLLNHYHQPDNPDGFNYAYVTGFVMLFAFMASFFLFSRERKKSKAKK